MKNNQGATLTRLLTAIVLLPAVLCLVWIAALRPVFIVFIAVTAAIGLREFFAMARAKGIETWPRAAIAFGVLMVLAAWVSADLMNATLVAGVIIVAWGQVLRGQVDLSALSVTLWGLFYAGWMPAHFVLLHGIDPALGAGLVTLLLAAIVLSDSGAYFVGRAIGKRKLAPKVSPNKTWEGAIGGVVAAVLGMSAAWYIHASKAPESLPSWSLWEYIATGALLAIAGQIGDLVESMMKRDAGVKDSGSLLPGHGGILDRCDGFLFAGPTLYYLLACLPAEV